MPNIGPGELILILVIALVIIGPGRLPDVGSALGKSIREFRKASSDLGDSVKVDTSPLPPTPQDAPPASAPVTTAGTAEPTVAPPAAPAPPSTAPRPSEPTTGTN